MRKLFLCFCLVVVLTSVASRLTSAAPPQYPSCSLIQSLLVAAHDMYMQCDNAASADYMQGNITYEQLQGVLSGCQAAYVSTVTPLLESPCQMD